MILGIHHITAIASSAQRNYDFYTKVLGLRLVKKTVNFDDPGTYHFYFADGVGTPGTVLTFFPWEGIGRGQAGTGMATEIDYAVPPGSLAFWTERFERYGVSHDPARERFGEPLLPFRDPDGLNLNLTVPAAADRRKPWETSEVAASVATRGFHSVTLNLRDAGPTAAILTEVFGYRHLASEGSRHRYATGAVENAALVDLVESPGQGRGRNAAGTNHHVAFRVRDEDVLMAFREKIERRGLNITPKIDRDYLYSLYFREPGGVLFEIATDNPGFSVDEPVERLGAELRLPRRYEPSRAAIERSLPRLVLD
jgi:glyoxalase family protein